METLLLMQVKYEATGSFLIPNKRQYKKSTWNGAIDDKPWIFVTWSNIRFNNGLNAEWFNK